MWRNRGSTEQCYQSIIETMSNESGMNILLCWRSGTADD
jgi:hypothetical protein